MSQNPFTIDAMAKWAAKKKGWYNWDDAEVCACAQYAEYLGVEGWHSISLGDHQGKFWSHANSIACEEPHTFKSLAKRLEVVALI